MKPSAKRAAGRTGQRGVVLIFTLIVLLVMTIGAVALIKSMNTALFSAGNLAFRRDLGNQGELAVSTVLNQFKTGGVLAGSSSTTNNVPASNYSATTLSTNAQGIPSVLLLGTTSFVAAGNTAGDLPGATSDVTIRYVVDRLCSTSGSASSALCVESSAAPTGGTAGSTVTVTPPTASVYRLSVRVMGPRSTEVFLQTTFTKPN